MTYAYATEQSVLNSQWNAANMAIATEEQRQRPFVLLRPPIYPDGTAWCVLLGDDLMTGIAGFGDTPEAAAKAFDEAWYNCKTPKAMLSAKGDLT